MRWMTFLTLNEVFARMALDSIGDAIDHTHIAHQYISFDCFMFDLS
jgi:hypothetical protein